MSGKLTLYDFLVCLIPGGLLLLCIVLCFNPYVLSQKLHFTEGILLSVVSYIVGLLWKFGMEYIWNNVLGYRNSPNVIINELYEAEIPNKTIEKIEVDFEKLCQENNSIKSAFKIVYYKHYYKALEYKNSSIPILEAQLAFLRSMTIILLFYIVPCIILCDEEMIKPYIRFFIFMPEILIILSYLSFNLAVNIQNKIYKLVWEDSYYASKLKD